VGTPDSSTVGTVGAHPTGKDNPTDALRRSRLWAHPMIRVQASECPPYKRRTPYRKRKSPRNPSYDIKPARSFRQAQILLAQPSPAQPPQTVREAVDEGTVMHRHQHRPGKGLQRGLELLA